MDSRRVFAPLDGAVGQLPRTGTVTCAGGIRMTPAGVAVCATLTLPLVMWTLRNGGPMALAVLFWSLSLGAAAILVLSRRPKLATLVAASLLFAASGTAANLAVYRGAQLGMDIKAVAAAFHIDPSSVTTIHRRPAVLQELEWHPQQTAAPSDAETVESIVFSFYDGKLYRIFITYESDKTDGLTHEDMVEAISAVYGNAARPAATVRTGSSMNSYATEKVLARWEDSESSVSLVQPDYPPNYELVVFSKSMESRAEAALTEADRLAVLEAPQRERNRMTKEAEDLRTKADKARLANKPKFKP